MGLCNLENIDEKIQLRKERYEYYKNELACLCVTFQKIIASRYNYIYMPVCFKDISERDKVYAELVKNGIKPRKYFSPLTVDFDYFKDKGVNLVKKYGLNIASDIANRVLRFPLYPDLKIKVIDKSIHIIKKIIKK